MYRSTLTHKEHKVEAQKGTPENKWNRDDFDSGLFAKSIEENKLKKQEKEDKFNSGLSEDGAMARIAENGTTTEKAKAFDYMAKNQPEQPQPKTYSNDWHGRKQKEKDDRLDMVKNIMNKAKGN